MSIKILAIGDPHFKTSNAIECELMIYGIMQSIDMVKPDFVVILGDILHTHEIINVYPYVRSIKFFEQIKDKAPLYVLIGNHDRPNNADFLSDYSPYYGIKYMPNTYIVDKPLLHNIKDKNFIFIPYVPNGRFMEAIEIINDNNILKDNMNNICMIFGHQEFKGSKMGAIISEKGDEWPINYPPVITGHIHDYSRPQSNILYTGTPLQHGFGDSVQKTISLITISENNKEIIWDEKRINLNLPKKITFKLKISDIIGFNNSMLNNKNKYRIIIEGTQGEIDSCKNLKDIKNIENMGIKIKYKVYKNNSEIEILSNNINIKNILQNNTYITEKHEKYIIKLHSLLYKTYNINDKGLIFWYEKLFIT